MNKNKIQDERILQARREIQSSAYNWIVIILLISVIVQQFFMNAPFSQFAVELFILIGSGLYTMIRNLKKGIDIWNPAGAGKKKLLLHSILSGIASVILLAILSGNYNAPNLLSYFVSFVIFFFTFRLIMTGINHKRQQTLDKMLDEDEMNE